jgi:toxin-antitoxin system PIN domain toxin
MLMPDVNMLVYAHREDAHQHKEYAQWLRSLAEGDEPFALSELVLHGFIRVVTNRRIFLRPTPLPDALAFVDELRRRPNSRLVRPGPRHWDIFVDLCTRAGASGGLVADAYHAALAIEHGCEWVTNDADFGRFQGLRWRTLSGGTSAGG